ncbi:MAG: hypothetical protein LBM09_01715 [Candidatus Nomurabacteria bacterium]|jgi:hypothetical protein|nr:hypothetical protein [Candidatus Nomurabacteria bacterium]
MNNYQVDRAKWAKMSLFARMGNIGSEVGRAINAHRRKNFDSQNAAIDRALDLFDATTDVEKNLSRRREILRARDQFLALFFDNNFADADNLEKYFTEFAIAERITR